MLIALLVITVFSMGGTEPFDKSYMKAVRQVVADATARDEVIDLLKEANKVSRELTRDTAELVEDLETTAENYQTTRDDYLPILARLGQSRSQAPARYTSVVFEMRNRMSRDQWQAVFDRD